MSTKTIILATMPNRIGNLQLQNLTTSPAFRKTIVPGGPGKSLLGIRPASDRREKPVAIEIKLENQLLETSSDYESHSTRKRQRLDHLTMEEKLMRRKLKNRVAAQTARDRKKARMDELEDLVSAMEKKVDNLLCENSRLKNVMMLLETENKYLKEKLENQDKVKSTLEPPSTTAATTTTSTVPVTTTNDVTLVKREVEEDANSRVDVSVEQAWPISAPLQKEQETKTPCSRWTKPSVCWRTIIMSLMIYLTSYNNAARNYSEAARLKKILQSLKKNHKLNHLVNERELRQLVKWWGPHQQSWNPSKN